ADLTSGFPTGTLAPVQVIVADDAGTLTPGALNPYVQRLAHLPGIASGGLARIAPDGHPADIDLVLTDNPTRTAALHTITGTVRPVAHAQAPAGTVALVGVYLFVASIGTDYNILMISRVREELRAGASPREATRAAIGHAGPSVA